MRPVEFFNIFNPFSFESKQAALKFKNLDLLKKIAVIALTVLTTLATCFMVGLAGVLVFRVMVDKFASKQHYNSSTAEKIQNKIALPIILPLKQKDKDNGEESQENSVSFNVLPPEQNNIGLELAKNEEKSQESSALPDILPPEQNNKGLELAKKWAWKVVPYAVPQAKLPLALFRAGATVKEAVDRYYEGDTLGSIKKVAPLVVGTAAIAYGGPVVAAATTAYQAYSLVNLISDTYNHLNEEPIFSS